MGSTDDTVLLSSLSAIANERDEALSLLSKVTGDMFQLMGPESNSLRLLLGCSSLVEILGMSKDNENNPCNEWASFFQHVCTVLSGMTNVIKLVESSGYVSTEEGKFMECPIPPTTKTKTSHLKINKKSVIGNPVLKEEKERVDQESINSNEDEELHHQMKESSAALTICKLENELKEAKSALLMIHDKSLYNNPLEETKCLKYYETQLKEQAITKRELMIYQRKVKVAEAKANDLRKQVDQLLVLAYPIEHVDQNRTKVSVDSSNKTQKKFLNTAANNDDDDELITLETLKELLKKQEVVIEQQRLDISSVASVMDQMRSLRKLEVQRMYQACGKMRLELDERRREVVKLKTYAFDLEMELTLHGLNSRIPRDGNDTKDSKEDNKKFHFLTSTSVSPSQLRSHEILARAIFLHQKRLEWAEDDAKTHALLQTTLETLQQTRKKEGDFREDGGAKGTLDEVEETDCHPNSKTDFKAEGKKDERGGEEESEEHKEIKDQVSFLQNVSRNWNLLGLGAMDEFLNESYTWERDTGDLVGEWGEIQALEPPPPHSLNSPLVNEVLCQWTGDVLKQKALMSWLAKIIDEKDKETDHLSRSPLPPVPTMQLTRLSKDSVGGFLALVFPLLLRRQDIAIEVQTRERRSTAYDMRVQISRINVKKKTSNGDMRRSHSEASLPQTSCVNSQSEEEDQAKRFHHLALRAAILGHVVCVAEGSDGDSEEEVIDTPRDTQRRR